MMEFLFTYGLYAVALLLIVCGVAGTIVPALPGIPMIFVGAWIIAYVDQWQYFGLWTLVFLGVLTGLSILIDTFSQTLGAQKAGATKYGLWGAGIGTVAGIFFGLIGIFIFPVIGAFIGEFFGHQDMRLATKVSWATWVWMIFGIAAKVAIAFVMIGVVLFMRFF